MSPPPDGCACDRAAGVHARSCMRGDVVLCRMIGCARSRVELVRLVLVAPALCTAADPLEHGGQGARLHHVTALAAAHRDNIREARDHVSRAIARAMLAAEARGDGERAAAWERVTAAMTLWVRGAQGATS